MHDPARPGRSGRPPDNPAPTSTAAGPDSDPPASASASTPVLAPSPLRSHGLSRGGGRSLSARSALPLLLFPPRSRPRYPLLHRLFPRCVRATPEEVAIAAEVSLGAPQCDCSVSAYRGPTPLSARLEFLADRPAPGSGSDQSSRALGRAAAAAGRSLAAARQRAAMGVLSALRPRRPDSELVLIWLVPGLEPGLVQIELHTPATSTRTPHAGTAGNAAALPSVPASPTGPEQGAGGSGGGWYGIAGTALAAGGWQPRQGARLLAGRGDVHLSTSDSLPLISTSGPTVGHSGSASADSVMRVRRLPAPATAMGQGGAGRRTHTGGGLAATRGSDGSFSGHGAYHSALSNSDGASSAGGGTGTGPGTPPLASSGPLSLVVVPDAAMEAEVCGLLAQQTQQTPLPVAPSSPQRPDSPVVAAEGDEGGGEEGGMGAEGDGRAAAGWAAAAAAGPGQPLGPDSGGAAGAAGGDPALAGPAGEEEEEDEEDGDDARARERFLWDLGAWVQEAAEAAEQRARQRSALAHSPPSPLHAPQSSEIEPADAAADAAAGADAAPSPLPSAVIELLGFACSRGWAATASHIVMGLVDAGHSVAAVNRAVAAAHGPGWSALHLAAASGSAELTATIAGLWRSYGGYGATQGSGSGSGSGGAGGSGAGGGGGDGGGVEAAQREWRAMLEAPGPGGLTPLHLAAVLPHPAPAALDLLSAMPAESLPGWFGAAAVDGCTPAHYAARAGNAHLNQHALMCLATGAAVLDQAAGGGGVELDLSLGSLGPLSETTDGNGSGNGSGGTGAGTAGGGNGAGTGTATGGAGGTWESDAEGSGLPSGATHGSGGAAQPPHGNGGNGNGGNGNGGNGNGGNGDGRGVDAARLLAGFAPELRRQGFRDPSWAFARVSYGSPPDSSSPPEELGASPSGSPPDAHRPPDPTWPAAAAAAAAAAAGPLAPWVLPQQPQQVPPPAPSLPTAEDGAVAALQASGDGSAAGGGGEAGSPEPRQALRPRAWPDPNQVVAGLLGRVSPPTHGSMGAGPPAGPAWRPQRLSTGPGGIPQGLPGVVASPDVPRAPLPPQHAGRDQALPPAGPTGLGAAAPAGGYGAAAASPAAAAARAPLPPSFHGPAAMAGEGARQEMAARGSGAAWATSTALRGAAGGLEPVGYAALSESSDHLLRGAPPGNQPAPPPPQDQAGTGGLRRQLQPPPSRSQSEIEPAPEEIPAPPAAGPPALTRRAVLAKKVAAAVSDAAAAASKAYGSALGAGAPAAQGVHPAHVRRQRALPDVITAGLLAAATLMVLVAAALAGALPLPASLLYGTTADGWLQGAMGPPPLRLARAGAHGGAAALAGAAALRAGGGARGAAVVAALVAAATAALIAWSAMLPQT